MSELSDLKGVGPTTIEKLEDAGLGTKMSLAVSSPVEVSTIAGMSEAVARKIIKAARESLQLGFEKAKDYVSKKKENKKLQIGCDVFDDMLGGGFDSGTIIEIYGETASGKTQLSHLSVVAALGENPENKAIYLDTENTFKEERIRDFSEAKGLDIDDVMERLYVTRAYNSDHQMLLIDELEKILQQDSSYRIVVIDSLTSHFRSDFSGRGELAGRQQKLNKHLHQLLKIADLYGLVIIVTNQVQSDPGQFYGNPIKPIGGNILSHSVTSIIYIRKGKQGSRHAELVDSPYLPNNECDYWIVKGGLTTEKPK